MQAIKLNFFQQVCLQNFLIKQFLITNCIKLSQQFSMSYNLGVRFGENFKNHGGEFSQKLPNKWLLVNHTKPTKHFLLKLPITIQGAGNKKTVSNCKIMPLTVQCPK